MLTILKLQEAGREVHVSRVRCFIEEQNRNNCGVNYALSYMPRHMITVSVTSSVGHGLPFVMVVQ